MQRNFIRKQLNLPSPEIEPKNKSQSVGNQFWIDTCNKQGWNDESQITHLEGVLEKKGLFDEFAAYIKNVAEKESSMGDEDLGNDSTASDPCLG